MKCNPVLVVIGFGVLSLAVLLWTASRGSNVSEQQELQIKFIQPRQTSSKPRSGIVTTVPLTQDSPDKEGLPSPLQTETVVIKGNVDVPKSPAAVLQFFLLRNRDYIFTPHDVLEEIDIKHSMFHNSQKMKEVFAKEHCKVYFDTESCKGRVECVVPTSQREPSRSRKLSHNSDLHNFIVRYLGPHGLRVSVEGPDSVMARTTWDARTLTYTSYFEVMTAGVYKLTMKLETEDYKGYDDLQSTIVSPANRYVLRGEPTLSCLTGGSPLTFSKYIWTKTSEERLHRLRQEFTHPLTGAQWTLHGAPSHSYIYDKSSIELCVQEELRSSKVLFIGDSQPRTLFRHHEATMWRKRASQQKGGNMTSSFEHHSAQFIWDQYLSTILERLHEYAEYGLVVFGYGPHLASWGQWTLEKYIEHTYHLMKRIAGVQTQQRASGRGKKVVKFIWVASPAWPKYRAGVMGFRISNTRLGLWNSISRRMAKHFGIPSVDFFELSWPHIKLHRGDGMHYDHSIVLYNMLDLIWEETCGKRRQQK